MPVQTARGDSCGGLDKQRSKFAMTWSWSGETAAGRDGRAGGGNLLRAPEHEEQWRHRHEDLQMSRKPRRQAWKTHHAAVDGRCKRRFEAGPQRRRKNDAHLLERCGWHPAKRRKQHLSEDEECGAGELPGRGYNVARHWKVVFF